MLNWDDLRFLLAAAEAGSMAAAARRLGVDQTTVARRVASAERALGTRVFRREGLRLLVTRSGRSLIDRAALIERQIKILACMADEAQNSLAGRVRIAAPITFATRFLVPRLAGFQRIYPQIQLELICDVNVSTMARADTDVGLRISHEVAAHLDVRAVGDLAFCLYANPVAMQKNGIAFDATALGRNPFVGYSEELAELPEGRWVMEILRNAEPVLRVNTTIGLLAAAEAGIGITPLPCYAGDSSPALQRVGAASGLRIERLSVVTLRETRHLARVRAAVDFVARTIREEQRLLSGALPIGEPLGVKEPS